MKLGWRLWLTVALALPAFAQTVDTTAPKPTSVFLDQANVLHYDGELDAEANRRLFELHRYAPLKPKRMIISSAGGSIYLGMDVGEWVRDNGIEVEVDRGCLSSCANYIFTAAKKRYLRAHSTLMWHGGTASLLKPNASPDDPLRKGAEREIAFFSSIGVDRDLLTYGFSRYAPADLLESFRRGTKIQGFDYSLEDLADFGVSNIELLDGEWDWRRFKPDYFVVRAKVDRG
jgi:hypothetical protein